ncbi:MAG TPA: hypothetical protein VKY19_01310 [Ktedonosporobacter sp.]|jgi:hypothetical protein|nr:hypothetical protein [Ktedonosporobacter sp.]
MRFCVQRSWSLLACLLLVGLSIAACSSSALRSGRVDAVVVSAPVGTIAEVQGFGDTLCPTCFNHEACGISAFWQKKSCKVL